ncbi:MULTISPECIES: CRISPR-associated endonuclease Cas2 [Hydrogenophilus]|jgi:CRISPR-associated endonuclease Cas2|uniref:CRISPR-associated endoribonuclease Cas2 n=1 Tax=Hydrogenophilus thermoluteolus TaxID=297 RepID=A0A2Z6DXC0_HYDTE|nr:CRISPR-associated endonuclease Cas2 [Hydrogenophilus thermoluteolus]MBW7657187.1 CRISPR-associated endonuclease Cas2 [Hydrogenophilus thermoluteolus]BBD76979.1 CRISPR-associated protein Cas2 [Hydrogenophilus thermoluteolus]GLW60020.1 hypothetical protein Hthe01_03690 [Hydrogenophilus thermoluteolus]HCO76699.1 CRISPR-associated endonuclease Cas2 [Rhodocyclaceae bacterium]
MATFLICYDITDPKRLARTHRYFTRVATPIQYSVFIYQGDERSLRRIMERAVCLINPKKDDLRCYPLPAGGWRKRIGRAVLPEGIHLSVLPPDL